MAQGQGDAGDGVPARRRTREEKERLRIEFGARLRVLLELTGLSSRQFAALFPAYRDSTVRKYVLGENLPRWNFLNDLLTEVTRRTDDPAAPQRRTELFTAYRTVLIETGARPRGNDQNSILLSLLDGEEALHRLREELAEVRTRENQLRLDLEEALREKTSPAGQERRRRLEEEARAMAERRGDLVRRRDALVTRLDADRVRLSVLEETDQPGDPVLAGTGAGAGVHRAWVPPLPPGQPAAVAEPPEPRRRRKFRLIGGAAAVALLIGTGAAAGIWAAGGHDAEDRAVSPSPQPTTPATPSDSVTSAPATSDPAAPVPATPVPSGTAPSGPATDTVRWTGHGVALTYLDLDTVPVSVLSSNSKASIWASYGDTDEVTLYGMNGGFFTTEPTIAMWEKQTKPDRKACADRVSTNGTETLPVTPGARFCVTTAEGRTAYIEVEKMDKALAAYEATITIWEA